MDEHLRRTAVALATAVTMLVPAGPARAGPVPMLASASTISAADAGNRTGHDRDGERQRVIISTDYGLGLVNGRFSRFPGPAPVDDAYAVTLAAANSDRFDVLGLVITFGNDVMLPELRAAERAMAELGLDVPVVAGAQVPYANPPVRFFDDAPLTDWCVNDGVRFMADELRKGPVTVLALGPFTDLACLVQNFPEEASRISRIVGVAGSRGGTLLLDGTEITDTNFTSDPLALRILLEHSDIPFVAMMFEVTSSVAISAAQLRDLATSPAPGVRYVGEASLLNAAETRDGMIPFDAHAVNYLLDPGAYDCFAADFLIVAGQPGVEPSLENQFVVSAGRGRREILGCDAWSTPRQPAAFIDRTLASVVAVGENDRGHERSPS